MVRMWKVYWKRSGRQKQKEGGEGTRPLSGDNGHPEWRTTQRGAQDVWVESLRDRCATRAAWCYRCSENLPTTISGRTHIYATQKPAEYCAVLCQARRSGEGHDSPVTVAFGGTRYSWAFPAVSPENRAQGASLTFFMHILVAGHMRTREKSHNKHLPFLEGLGKFCPILRGKCAQFSPKLL